MFIIYDFYFLEFFFGLVIVLLFLLSAKGFPQKKEGVLHQRSPFFDFLKGIAIISIVAIHATDIVPQTSFLKNILWFAIPLLFIESGYLLCARHKKEVDIKKYFSHIFFRIILIYLIFVIGIRIFLGQSLSISEILLDALLGRTNGNYYFIPIILQLYLLFPLIVKIKKPLKNYLIVVFLVSLGFYFLDVILQNQDWNSNLYSLAFSGRYLFFFFCGMLLSQFNVSKIKLSDMFPLMFVYLLGILCFSIIFKKIYLTYTFPLITMLLFLGLHNFSIRLTKHRMHFKVIDNIGKHSFIIYLIHTRFLYDNIKPFIMTLDAPWIVLYFAAIIFTLILSYCSSVIFMYLYGFLVPKSYLS